MLLFQDCDSIGIQRFSQLSGRQDFFPLPTSDFRSPYSLLPTTPYSLLPTP
ncbi:MAG: hypothetical protein F6J90_07475 [Moorea sp. SIOASIH]|uniref:hypothetical protein n=1 Tax=Moorena sp. SIOASIH TaxID=2607817 RepID=UPI0013B9B44E|nr:hypothetical protein [Moorena sp. SIOASIH]NEO36172.1 hypothetical protein [Moorena sp. SIOASIH]